LDIEVWQPNCDRDSSEVRECWVGPVFRGSALLPPTTLHHRRHQRWYRESPRMLHFLNSLITRYIHS
jgi:hypothetical protein